MFLRPFHVPERILRPAFFHGLDPHNVFRVYSRSLPHWRQEGGSYFVTFRFADSIPAEVVSRWEAELALWRERVVREESARGGKLSLETQSAWEEFQRQTLTRMENSLDECAGACWWRSESMRSIMNDAMLSFAGARYELLGFCVMPNHVHAAVTPLSGWGLESITKSWKGWTARMLHRRLGRTGTLWQAESFDRLIRDEDHLRRVIRYMARNPTKAGLPTSDADVWINPALLDVQDGVAREPSAGWAESPW